MAFRVVGTFFLVYREDATGRGQDIERFGFFFFSFVFPLEIFRTVKRSEWQGVQKKDTWSLGMTHHYITIEFCTTTMEAR